MLYDKSCLQHLEKKTTTGPIYLYMPTLASPLVLYIYTCLRWLHHWSYLYIYMLTLASPQVLYIYICFIRWLHHSSYIYTCLRWLHHWSYIYMLTLASPLVLYIYTCLRWLHHRSYIYIYIMLTLASLGDHCMSSTEEVWALYGRWSTCQVPPSRRVHKWMFLLQSPVARRPNSKIHQIYNVKDIQNSDCLSNIKSKHFIF
jgi:hypothetical protein